MAFFTAGERKIRPGVYVRIVTRGEPDLSVILSPPIVPEPGEGEPTERVLLLVAEGTLYPVGPALSLGDGGDTVIVADAVNATVYGEALVVDNPGS